MAVSTYIKIAKNAIDIAMKKGYLNLSDQEAQEVALMIANQIQIAVELVETAGKGVSMRILSAKLTDKVWSIGKLGVNKKNKCAKALISLAITGAGLTAEETFSGGIASVAVAIDLLNALYDAEADCNAKEQVMEFFNSSAQYLDYNIKKTLGYPRF